MADLFGFDANQVEPTADFDLIPAGKYAAIIVESEMLVNKAGTGKYLQLTFELLDDKYSGRRLWSRLNLQHPNATATKIAAQQLSAICRAVDVLAPRDSTDLHNLPLIIHVRCKKRTDTGELVNEIKGYSKRDVAASSVDGTATQSTPPWLG